MLEFIGSGSHYCVHYNRAFVGFVSCYLGLWSFQNRQPFGWDREWEPNDYQQAEIRRFIASRN